jgi:glycosyltransferase involved in cell wall biosynthesis
MLLVVAIMTLGLWVALTTDWFLGVRRVAWLTGSAPNSASKLEAYPRLSVVIPALNEARAIEASLGSILSQDYPNLEILVLNDRSTDQTGEILERMQRKHARLKVIHIEVLPEGWLGKNHALYVGAQHTRGEWLLFTDADVQFEPHALSAALAYAMNHKLDHLTALPHLFAKSSPLKAFVSAFMLLFSFGILRASAPATEAHVGLGAFNLLRRSTYDGVGGHKPIALRPDDDMMLGKLVKTAGFKQEVVFATDLLRVEWYTGVGEAVRGLNKNAFTGLAYSLPVVLLVNVTLVVTHIVPFVAVFFTAGGTRLLFALVLANIAFVYAVSRRFIRVPVPYALLHPLGMAILVYAISESAAKATWQGGISWRGTFYPLEQLKRNRV